MIPNRHITPRGCEELYPISYLDIPRPDKAERYLVLHEVYDRHQGNWRIADQWSHYKGIITWNSVIYEEYKNRFNMVFCPQFMHMAPERTDTYSPLESRPHAVCCMYGPPASVDTPIMMARYDIPLHLHDAGMDVNAYGITPDRNRPEYRKRWAEIFRGSVPSHRKRDVISLHKFSMAFENSRNPRWASGWVTEKIYDCLGSGTVPIYWGAPDVTNYIPPEVFIDYREFANNNELHKYLNKTPMSTFQRMSEDGLDWFDAVKFDLYLDTYERLQYV